MARQRLSEQASIAVRKMLSDSDRTQEWLANTTGIPMRTLARRLHRVNPSGTTLDELSRIAAALNTDVVSLLAAARATRTARPEQVAS